MAKPKITPSPWHVDEDGCKTSGGLPIVRDKNGRLVAMLTSRNLDNAYLLAAAPRLLEAVKRFLESSRCKNGCHPNDMTCDSSFAQSIISDIENHSSSTEWFLDDEMRRRIEREDDDDDTSKALYVHASNCPGDPMCPEAAGPRFCNHTCNGKLGFKLARQVNRKEHHHE